MGYQDNFQTRNDQSFRRYTKWGTRIALILGAITIIIFFFSQRSNIDGPDEILALSVDNYYDVTAVMLPNDAEKCTQHLKQLQEEMPEYIEVVSVTSDNGFTKCISVKFAVSSDKLKKAYFTDTEEIKEVLKDLKDRGMLTDEDIKKILVR